MASNDKVQQVQSFNFLGLWITSDARYEKEIKRCITLAKASFNNIKNIFRDHKLTISLKRLSSALYAQYGTFVWL